MKSLSQYIQEAWTSIHAGVFNVDSEAEKRIFSLYKKVKFPKEVKHRFKFIEQSTTDEKDRSYDAFWIYREDNGTEQGIVSYKENIYVTSDLSDAKSLANFFKQYREDIKEELTRACEFRNHMYQDSYNKRWNKYLKALSADETPCKPEALNIFFDAKAKSKYLRQDIDEFINALDKMK